ncbi:hypothetical protein [Candidatus Binatus sp.]|jgi:quinol monooxygenase YgiN|uniref:hypothetical protein n=1 Tax=Candidatus Binatus sp. TaxID=2811406 RepID=UPI003BE614B1
MSDPPAKFEFRISENHLSPFRDLLAAIVRPGLNSPSNIRYAGQAIGGDREK